MDRIRVAIVGYGRLGRGVHRLVKMNPDIEVTQIITRDPTRVRRQVKGVPVFSIGNFAPLADVAVLCGGSKDDLFGRVTRTFTGRRLGGPEKLGHGPYFAQFFNTVDSFDTHARIADYSDQMSRFAALNRHTSIVSAGWDPGTFSLERVLADSFIPMAKHYTFWGPGVSQGHSDAVRRIKGVVDARQYTLPVKPSVAKVRQGSNPSIKPHDRHTRLVYVVTEKGTDRKQIERQIKSMPNYFAGFETKVIFVTQQVMEKKHHAYPHAGFVLACADKSVRPKSVIEYRCEWASNPDGTAGILVACVRACYRLNKMSMYGAFTMLDVPPVFYSPHPRGKLLKSFM